MMPYEIIKSSEAPEKPVKKQVGKSAAYFREIILSLEPGKTAKIELEEGQTQRGVKVSLGRVASGLDTKVVSWSVDGDDQHVYVELDDQK